MKEVAGRIRVFLKSLPRGRTVSAAETARLLDCPVARVSATFRDFSRRGEIERVGRVRWRYTGVKRLWDGRGEFKPRMLRAMHVKVVFTCSEIAFLSGADASYVRKVIRKLRSEDDVAQIGRKADIRGISESLYRVRNADEFFLKYLTPNTPENAAVK